MKHGHQVKKTITLPKQEITKLKKIGKRLGHANIQITISYLIKFYLEGK